RFLPSAHPRRCGMGRRCRSGRAEGYVPRAQTPSCATPLVRERGLCRGWQTRHMTRSGSVRGSSVVAPVSGRELDPEQAAQLEAAFAAILPRADSIADDITDRLAELESPWYDPGHPERYAELRASTRAHIRQGIEL